MNRRTYVNGNISVDISSSVGIAIALDSEQDFETVYKMADNALYRSKKWRKELLSYLSEIVSCSI